MAKKNEYNYFDMKAAADKKSRGNFILNLPPREEEDGTFTDRQIVVKPFTVNKSFKAKSAAGPTEQLKFAFGDQQWETLIEVIGEDEITVLQEITKDFSEHFFGDVEGVDGGKEQ
ncbi:hypothetical protein [Rhodococcus erythropolis]|uniref:hypothetical protein n=1 Tax=Rhodococcus erythropolis TaxID=1833 RepID=UPI000877F27C|nr:hypothetical protein [Rhodococcus erythropolis]OFV79242.1 hypothetical protein RERY_02480 [Rhodococcus erythropolis]